MPPAIKTEPAHNVFQDLIMPLPAMVVNKLIPNLTPRLYNVNRFVNILKSSIDSIKLVKILYPIAASQSPTQTMS